MALGVALSACGGGAGDSDPLSSALFTPPVAAPAQTPLVVTTTTLPEASRGAFYGPVSLAATGHGGPYAWRVADGALPSGLSLVEDGTLLGTPQSSGFFSFQVEVTSPYGSARRTLAVAVDSFGASLDSGDLVYGDARSGQPVDLRAQGFSGSVAFEIVQNQSGGQFSLTNGSQGHGVWLPGQVPAEGALDIVRIRYGNESVDVQIPVRPDPMANHLARWGETDVWHIDVDRKHGNHPYALDLHWALAHVGMRNPASTELHGSVADDLAEKCLHKLLLENLNKIYARNPDGTSGILGVPISFVLEAPEGAVTAAPNGYIAGGAFRYSTIGLHMGASGGNLGYGLVDTSTNAGHENNTPGPKWSLGVFLQEIAPSARAAYDDFEQELEANPLSEQDVEVLKAILYGDTSSNPRYEMLHYVLDGLARTLAAVTSHEVGHGLGLHHNPEPVSVMFWAQAIHELAEYHFSADEYQHLRATLPGPGR